MPLHLLKSLRIEALEGYRQPQMSNATMPGRGRSLKLEIDVHGPGGAASPPADLLSRLEQRGARDLSPTMLEEKLERAELRRQVGRPPPCI